MINHLVTTLAISLSLINFYLLQKIDLKQTYLREALCKECFDAVANTNNVWNSCHLADKKVSPSGRQQKP